MRFYLLIILLQFFILPIGAKEKPVIALSATKSVKAHRIQRPVEIDGYFKEEVWKDADVADDFMTMNPTIGKKPYQPTEVRILYTDDAIYFGATLYDSEPDSIARELAVRDGGARADEFTVHLNPYNDGQNIFIFEVSAANVQTDIKRSATSNDRTWNVVWDSEVQITDNGWQIEMRIPYAAIRFPKSAVQKWGINFFRRIRRIHETSSWNLVDRTLGSTALQAGELTNIRNINAPFRLSMYPYISGNADFTPEGNAYAYSAGMDLKYGINESFTLDMTLIPDFGQRTSDNTILNLSPFEVRYSENRPFFNEGVELFEKAGLFYSRRIGAKPEGYSNVEDMLNEGDIILANPGEASMINATKISGRTDNGTGLGFFNALTKRAVGLIKRSNGEKEEILTEPLTNFNMLVYDKIIGKYSYINLINTNYYQPETNYIGNVTGTAFKISDRRNRYAFHGRASESLVTDKETNKIIPGSSMDVSLGKLNGNLYANYNFELMTDTYNPNDMGYLRRNNNMEHNLVVRYGIYEPQGKFLNYFSTVRLSYNSLYKPRVFTNYGLSLNNRATFKNFLTIGVNYYSSITNRYDYFEPRVEGRYFYKPASHSASAWLATDGNKMMSAGASIGGYIADGTGYHWSINPNVRLSDKLSFNHDFDFNMTYDEHGYVDHFNEDSIIFGQRDKKTIINTFSGAYIFNNKTSLRLKIRHYWSEVDYTSYQLLQHDGTLNHIANAQQNEDINFNVFNIDLIYSWNFAPGSFMTLMWKNNISEQEEIPNNEFYNFMQNFENTLALPQTNSISLKISYFFDYRYLLKS